MKLLLKLISFSSVIILIFFVSVSAALSQPVRISSDSDSLKAGQLFNLHIIFDNPDRFDRIMMPDSTFFSEPFEFRNRTRGLTPAGSDSVSIRLQFFGNEDTLITDLYALGISGADTTLFEIAEYPIYFRSILDEDDVKRPLKPIFEFTRSILPYILGFLLLMAILLVAYYYYKKYFPDEEEPEPKEPIKIPPFYHPGHALTAGIDRLEQDLHNKDVEVEEFYIRSGDLIRTYYEEVHGFPALEQTTREVLQEISVIYSSVKFTQFVRGILQECDLVKFAKFTPEFDQMGEIIVKLRTVADEVQRQDDHIIMAKKAEYNKKVLEIMREREEADDLGKS